MRPGSYLNSASLITGLYKGDEPFHLFLKSFYKQNKKYGSRDRKKIAQYCYLFFRLGKGFEQVKDEERIVIAAFLSNTSNELLALKPGLTENVTLSFAGKLKFLNAEDEWEKIFPFFENLSPIIAPYLFAQSFLIQPDLFLRIRPGRKQKVVEKLEAAKIDFNVQNENTIVLKNTTKAQDVLDINADVVIQDLNSQQVLNVVKDLLPAQPFEAWDCCAASGGKSILLKDNFPLVHLTVSDIRQNILHNLKKRFLAAGIKDYQSFIADIAAPNFSIDKKFDFIICDAPCTGSGTWSRTPEQLYFFREEKIKYYSDLQKKIAANACKALKPNGYFLYITCSVFTEENEEVVDYLKNNTSLQLVSMNYLKGYEQKADSLFSALFTS
jgi:16S rRNA (cytosine967-C5)-methyltransferase